MNKKIELLHAIMLLGADTYNKTHTDRANAQINAEKLLDEFMGDKGRVNELENSKCVNYLTIEEVYLESIWKVFNEANEDHQPMLSGNDELNIRKILKEYKLYK